ncbi:conserved hypothetical protein [Desulfonatronospira thiodismutans ASO3-1]|uniref:Addiction module component, TIGR02574 family n=1 Tax=Desulfonatronospira thiodismutans ASO3-1 TaxID=555779 RepID=D6STX7_9BACT|nr:addiction module protein [Desulfonatronospira thiodismutans]EFI34143.1 conserved hypothetical protein [Desulfonatronospira thiodismutans ASO3-1]
MKVAELASEALQLDPHDRALLAEAIWESLEDPFVSGRELSDVESIHLAIRRDEEIERGEVKPLSHSELMSRLHRNEG